MNVEFSPLERQYKMYEEEYKKAICEVMESGWYILGERVQKFENAFAKYHDTQYCVGLNSGLDALIFAIKALGIGVGDEVIVPANTYIATVLAITQNGAVPIFVEPDQYYNLDAEKIEEKISSKTRAIIYVHLYGQPSRIDLVKEVADKYHLFLVEDCAQAHGAQYKKQKVGTFGDVGCFSFYPTKNLGAFGDGGAIITNKADIAEKIQAYRNYGSKVKYHCDIEGLNSRLDEIQAALLQVKFSHLEKLNEERQKLANYYDQNIHNAYILKPQKAKDATHVYHQYVVRCENRDKFQKYLEKNGIATQIHYPIPPHLQKCYQYLGYKNGDLPITEKYANEVISLPIYNGMTESEQQYVTAVINDFQLEG